MFKEDDFDQFQLERGYCVIGGPAKYSPKLVYDRVYSQPNANAVVAARALEILGRLGSFILAWSFDKILGRTERPEYVRKRASQLRQALILYFAELCSSCAGHIGLSM